jgi:hypothetical protein
VAQDLLDEINGTPSVEQTDGTWVAGKSTIHGRAAPYRGTQDPRPNASPAPISGEAPRDALPVLVRSEVVETHMDQGSRDVVEGLRDSLGGLINEGGFVRESAPKPAQQTGGQTEHGGQIQRTQTGVEAELRQVPLEGGVLHIQQPAYQSGDVVRPVQGSDVGIVIPPGTRSLDNQEPGGTAPPQNPPT